MRTAISTLIVAGLLAGCSCDQDLPGFDWDALTSSSIETQKGKFKPAQMKEFQTTLQEAGWNSAYGKGNYWFLCGLPVQKMKF